MGWLKDLTGNLANAIGLPKNTFLGKLAGSTLSATEKNERNSAKDSSGLAMPSIIGDADSIFSAAGLKNKILGTQQSGTSNGATQQITNYILFGLLGIGLLYLIIKKK